MNRLYRITKFIHKWSSIIIALLLVYMSVSGILLNHPEVIAPVSVGSSLIPENYQIQNWNRSSITDLKYSKTDPSFSVIGGHKGIFISRDAGKIYSKIPQKGLPNSEYYNKTKTIYILENEKGINDILAGTYGGLYHFDLSKERWSEIKLGDKRDKIVKIMDYKEQIAVFSSSGAALVNPENLNEIQNVKLTKDEDETKLTMIEFIFQLHSGELWGLPGKLIFDAAGIILLFLCISGLYIWLSPKTSKFRLRLSAKANKAKWSVYKLFYKYHLKLGIIAAAVLLLIGVTGFFMRPPGIVAIMSGEVPVSSIPFLEMENPWKHRIRNAMYDKVSDKVIIDAKDGFWISGDGIGGTYRLNRAPVPIFAMGATVLEQDYNGDYLIGSFAGLYRVTPESGKSIDAITGKAPFNISMVRPGSNLVTSYFKTPIGEEFITTHFKGLVPVNAPFGMNGRFRVTDGSMNETTMSLWNYLFELHNGRIFQAWIGDFYILVIPLMSLVFVISLLTGIFDWIYLKFKNRKPRQKAAPDLKTEKAPLLIPQKKERELVEVD
jgi:hypothetical protein